MKTKRENEKDEERKDKTGIIISPHVVKTRNSYALFLKNFTLTMFM